MSKDDFIAGWDHREPVITSQDDVHRGWDRRKMISLRGGISNTKISSPDDLIGRGDSSRGAIAQKALRFEVRSSKDDLIIRRPHRPMTRERGEDRRKAIDAKTASPPKRVGAAPQRFSSQDGADAEADRKPNAPLRSIREDGRRSESIAAQEPASKDARAATPHASPKKGAHVTPRPRTWSKGQSRGRTTRKSTARGTPLRFARANVETSYLADEARPC